MTSDVRQGPTEPAEAPAPPRRLTWREKRWLRRRRRRRVEEILGWILVPLIVLAGYWLVHAVLAGMGTSPGAVVDAIKAFLAGGSRTP